MGTENGGTLSCRADRLVTCPCNHLQEFVLSECAKNSCSKQKNMSHETTDYFSAFYSKCSKYRKGNKHPKCVQLNTKAKY
jgi:hypothetical protein